MNSTYISVSSDQPSGTRRDRSAPGSSSSGEGTATSASNSSFVHVPHPHRRPRSSVPNTGTNAHPSPVTAGAASSSRSPIRQVDGRASFLNTGDLDGDDVDDDEPWAEHGTWWQAVASENVDEVKEGIQDLEKVLSEGHLDTGATVVSRVQPWTLREANLWCRVRKQYSHIIISLSATTPRRCGLRRVWKRCRIPRQVLSPATSVSSIVYEQDVYAVS